MSKRILSVLCVFTLILGMVFLGGNSVLGTPEPNGTNAEKINNSALMPQYVYDDLVNLEDSGGSPVLYSADWLKTAIIVELNLETATYEGTLESAVKTLDHYEEMGVNCLWVMPVHQQGVNAYTNYGLNSIDPALTGTNDYAEGWKRFAEFVQEAHNRNIRILLDVITWGVDNSSPLLTSNPELFSGANEWGGKAYKWKDATFQTWYKTTLLDIVKKTNIDGLRCDVEPTSKYTNYAMFKDVRDQALSTLGKKLVLMGEQENTRQATYDIEEWGVMNWNYVNNAANPKDFFMEAGQLNIVDAVKNGTAMSSGGQSRFYTYCISCHDWPAKPASDNELIKMGYQAILAPYIPIWYNGQEMGGGASAYASPEPLDLLNNGNSKTNTFFETIKKYIEIRRTYSDIFEYMPNNHRNSNICKVSVSGLSSFQPYARYKDGKGVLVIPNGTSSEVNTTVTIPYSGMNISSGAVTVSNLMTGAEIATGNVSTFQISIKPGEMAVVLVDDGTAASDASVISVISDIDAIGTVTAASGALISAARSAYNALNGSQKDLVSNANTLKQAEAAYTAIKYPDSTKYPVFRNSVIPSIQTLSSWGWPVTLTSTIGNGLNIKYTSSGVGFAHRMQLSDPIKLDGAHLGLTLNASDYWGRMFNIMIAGSSGKDNGTGAINFKIDTDGNAIFGAANEEAMDHTGMDGYAGSNDRITVSMGSGLKDIEIEFKVNMDSSITMFFNGNNITVTASDVAKATGISDFDNVYLYITPAGGELDYTINYMHSGSLGCYENALPVINKINEIGVVTPTSGQKITDAGTLYSQLSAVDKTVVSNYADLTYAEAAYPKVVNNPDAAYGVKTSMLTPNDKNPWWDSSVVTYENLNGGGARVVYQSTGVGMAHRHRTKSAMALDGMHLGITVNTPDSDYWGNIINIAISSNGGKGEGADYYGTLRFKFDLLGGGQMYGFSDQASVDHSQLPGYDPGRASDRVFIPDYVNNNLNFKFKLNSDGGITLNVNGYDFIVSAADFARATGITDPDNVYVYIFPEGNGGVLDYTLDYMHSGEQPCYGSVNDVYELISSIGTVTSNSGAAITAARSAYNLLKSNEKPLVENYSVLTAAETAFGEIVLTDSEYNITNSMLVPNEGGRWWASNVVQYADMPGGGTRVAFQPGSGVNLAYRHRVISSGAADGMHLNMTVNTPSNDDYGNMFHIAVSSTSNSGEGGSYADALRFKIDILGGQVFGFSGSASVDHSKLPGYDPVIAGGAATDRVFISNLNSNISFRLFLNDDGSATAVINGYNFEVSAADFERATGITGNPDNVFLSIAPEGGNFDFTINSFHYGESVCYDSVNSAIAAIAAIGTVEPSKAALIESARAAYDSLSAAEKALVTNYNVLLAAEALANTDEFHYGVKNSMLIPNAGSPWWGDVQYTDLPGGGTRVAYQNARPFAYRHVIAKPGALHGMQAKLSVNSTEYNDKIFNFMIASSSGLDNYGSSINFRVDVHGGQIVCKVNGTPIDHTVLQGYNPEHTERVFVPSDCLSGSTTDLDLFFTMSADGGLVFTINGYDFKVSAADVLSASGLSDLNNVYLYIAPDGGAIDYTIHTFRGGENKSYDLVENDANGDKVFDGRDITAIGNHLMKKEPLGAVGLFVCDPAKKLEISIIDLLTLREKLNP